MARQRRRLISIPRLFLAVAFLVALIFVALGDLHVNNQVRSDDALWSIRDFASLDRKARNDTSSSTYEPDRLVEALQDAWNNLKFGHENYPQSGILLGKPQEKSQTRLDEDATLVTCSVVEQLAQLVYVSKRWTGPISVAVYLSNQTELESFTQFYRQREASLPNVQFHFLLGPIQFLKPRSSSTYPVGKLMNLAIRGSPTDYLLVLDLDFLPCEEMYSQVLNLLQHEQEVRVTLDDNTLLVLPSYESKSPQQPLETLLKASTNNQTLIRTMRSVTQPHVMHRLHGSMDMIIYRQWKTKRPGWIYPCPFEYGMEPTVLANKQGMPLFPEQFLDPWFARSAWIEACDAEGFKIAVLRKFFVYRTMGPTRLPDKEPSSHEYWELRKRLPNRYERFFGVPTLQNFYTMSVSDLCAGQKVAVEGVSDSLQERLLCAFRDFLSSRDRRRQIPFAFFGKNALLPTQQSSSSDSEIGLALQCSIDRMDRIVDGVKRWTGPMSVALYANSTKSIQQAVHFFNQHSDALMNASFHLFFEKVTTDKEASYPHNFLRNCALNFTQTGYVIILDADFTLSEGSYDGLLNLVRRNTQLRQALHNKTMMVIPAFERIVQHTDSALSPPVIPRNKNELRVQIQNNMSAPFHMVKFEVGHGATNFLRWFLNESTPFYEIEYERSFEPYVLARRRDLHWFWTGFRGFGVNKLSWYEESYTFGSKYAVLKDFFCYHDGQSSTTKRAPWWVQFERRIFETYLQLKARDLGDEATLERAKFFLNHTEASMNLVNIRPERQRINKE